MIPIDDFIAGFSSRLNVSPSIQPWQLTNNVVQLIEELISHLDHNYTIQDGIAIHKTATIETGVVMKSPVIIRENCFVGAHSYLRGGVYLGQSVTVGASCEIKSSLICAQSSIAHFNYIGNSIIGQNVNFEAGSITANHYNERVSKKIRVRYKSTIIDTETDKFGALVGNNSKIGANAVLSPGTILEKNSIVKRLELVEQLKE